MILPPKKDSKLASFYARAAKCIREKGWWNGRSAVGPSSVCLLQAVGVGKSFSPEMWEEYAKGLTALHLENGPRCMKYRKEYPSKDVDKCVSWNDDPSRTKKHVLALLDYAAKVYG